MVQVGVLEPLPCDEESVTPVARNTPMDFQFLHPRLTIVLPKEITDRIIPAKKRKVPIKRIIFLEVGVVALIHGSIGFELLVDLFEELGGAEVIIGTQHHADLTASPLNTNSLRTLGITFRDHDDLNLILRKLLIADRLDEVQ